MSVAMILPGSDFCQRSALPFPADRSRLRGRNLLRCMNPKLSRSSPGARFRPIRAASMASVPLPHMGLMKFPSPVQPVARTTAAASVSCMGAARGILRYPRRDKRLARSIQVNNGPVFLPVEMDHRTVALRTGIRPRARLLLDPVHDGVLAFQAGEARIPDRFVLHARGHADIPVLRDDDPPIPSAKPPGRDRRHRVPGILSA